MSYCINPSCVERENVEGAETCKTCGTTLSLNGRIRLIAPLRPIDLHRYSDVFEVDDEGTRRVMKVLKWQDPKLIELLERESLILRLLRHPGIPKSRIYDYFTFTPNNSSIELHCFCMDKVEGENLEQWMKSHGKISQSMVEQWLKELVKILHKVHRSGFFHRDIKPANIIVQPDGKLALIDFGAARQVTNTYLAKIGGGGANKTGIGGQYEITVVSSAWYSPLEQIYGQAVPQSDFYALGRTFAYLLTGIELFKLPSDPLSGKLLWRSHAPQINRPLADLIDEMLEPAPGKRPHKTGIILDRLDARVLETPDYKKSTPGEMQTIVTLTIDEFPAQSWQTDNKYVFEVDTGDYLITVELTPELFDKLEQAQEKYPRWTANMSGKIRRGSCGELSLESPKLRVYKSKLPAELDKKLLPV